MTRALRITGWTLIVAGVVVLLYVVYSLLFTGVATEAAQASMRDAWQAQVGALGAASEAPQEQPTELAGEEPAASEEPAAPTGPVPEGEAVAVLEFVRPGADPPVHAEPLFVVEGTGREELARGPGHYVGTALPGEDGNMAVAGHRTTYAAPFFHLDQLQEGDEIHVTGRDGRRHVYRFSDRRIVTPNDTWVLGPDPLDRGRPLLTLTTCHPRFSAAERMIVFAELVE